jgi:NAD(P)-dependent dehydrogenase (short-subunit alcohol dehydrogenase family)
MQRVLITGAGRGIGLELAWQYAARGDRVLAGCRAIARAPGLRVLVDQHRERVSILLLEVTDAGALAAAVQQTHQEVEGLDILINNVAINPSDATIPGPDGQQLLDEVRALEVIQGQRRGPGARGPGVHSAACARHGPPRRQHLLGGGLAHPGHDTGRFLRYDGSEMPW